MGRGYAGGAIPNAKTVSGGRRNNFGNGPVPGAKKASKTK